MPLTAKGEEILSSMKATYGTEKKAEEVFYASRNKGTITGVDAANDQKSPRRLTYYATKLPDKETWFQTPEGYRIYKNVPIARTGSQNYLGYEIKKNPGYKPEWNVGDDEVITVYRPESEVLAPEALASFEGKSVLDEHPPDPQVLIDAVDEYDGISRGHVMNVRTGERLADGEIGPIADLWVKHPDLNLKIENGLRDVSCGYTFMLAKDEHGKFIMTEIRGNHVAVVPTGRAGRLYGIGDSALESRNRRTIMAKSNFFQRIQAHGLKAWAAEAKPDELMDGLAELSAVKDKDEVAEKATEEEKAERDKKAKKDCEDGTKDADFAGLKRLIDEWLEEEEGESEHKGAADRFRGFIKKKGGKDAVEYGEDEMTDADKLEEEEKKDDKKEKKEAAEDADALILPADEHSKSEFSTGDAAKHLLTLKPVIAACKSKGAKDAYNALCKGVRQVKSGIKDGATDPFALLTRISSADGAADNEAEIPMFQFFNGKSHADGLKAYNDYVDRRAARARK
jgi:hypothetical protein